MKLSYILSIPKKRTRKVTILLYKSISRQKSVQSFKGKRSKGKTGVFMEEPADREGNNPAAAVTGIKKAFSKI